MGRARKVQLQHRQIAFPESNCCEALDSWVEVFCLVYSSWNFIHLGE